jgi:hypothetical protein
MGKLYEINQELFSLFCFEWDEDHQAWIYPDTGEFMTDEVFQARMKQLNMDKKSILEWIAKEMLNLSGDAKMLKEEKSRIDARIKRKESRYERFRQILERECGGEKTDLGVATFSYRKSEACVWDEKNEQDIIAWIEKHAYDDCLKYSEPEIRKDPLKKLINSGVNVPFASVEKRNKGSLK